MPLIILLYFLYAQHVSGTTMLDYHIGRFDLGLLCSGG